MLFVVGTVRIQLLLVRTVSWRTADLLFSSHYCYYTYRLMDWGVGRGVVVVEVATKSVPVQSVWTCKHRLLLKSHQQESSPIN